MAAKFYMYNKKQKGSIGDDQKTCEESATNGIHIIKTQLQIKFVW